MIILAGIIAAVGMFQAHIAEQNFLESEYSQEEYDSSYSEASNCEPSVERNDGSIVQNVCVLDGAESLRLDTVSRDAQSTTLHLTHIADGGGYCVWDMADDRSFKLKDLDTGKIYPLVMQETTMSACDDFTYGDYGEEFPLMLVYDALPATTKHIELYENLPADEQFSPTRFEPIELEPINLDATNVQVKQ